MARGAEDAFLDHPFLRDRGRQRAFRAQGASPSDILQRLMRQKQPGISIKASGLEYENFHKSSHRASQPPHKTHSHFFVRETPLWSQIHSPHRFLHWGGWLLWWLR